MRTVILILTILLFSSCSSNYSRKEVTRYFKEVRELNLVLMNHQELVRKSGGLEAISENIPEAKDLIKLLAQELNLTEIELYNINGEETGPGLAYRFGNPATDHSYSFLLFSRSQDDLESFRYYEQFVDCGKSEILNEHWAFSRIEVDCNN